MVLSVHINQIGLPLLILPVTPISTPLSPNPLMPRVARVVGTRW